MFTPLDRYSDRNMQINRHQYCALKVRHAHTHTLLVHTHTPPTQPAGGSTAQYSHLTVASVGVLYCTV